ncbi:ABC transporter permease [Nesterenkonia sp. MY13]|uniref:ABC transporter permease n=1 Tax=Nesterenkonia sedimenti TaxID=1463632 RepID=A0A7X8TLW0_9MICC|nr:ABC transporter permease [Nesterenkonia sedimenti]NLS10787.1 ABC transporter permease [Nesterenkonia sedimenti]
MSSSAEVQYSPRAIRLARWRRASGKLWKEFAKQKGGVVGLIGLGIFIILAIFGPMLVSENATSVVEATGERMAPPGDGYIFGTDDRGRSVAELTILGTRVTLIIGMAAAFLGMIIGTTVGIISGHFEGKISWVLMRIAEWFMNLPTLVLAVVLVVIMGRGMLVMVIAIGVTSWAGTARVVRAQTRAVEGRPYMERAKALGAGHGHQMVRHVLPNVMPLVLASTIMAVAGAILTESTLAFLGLYDPASVSWGRMLNQAWSAGAMTAQAWWYILAPGLMILLVVLCFTLAGRALETALNPRLRK